MIEKFFKSTKVIDQFKINSYGSDIDDFAKYLAERGYSSPVAMDYIRVAVHFSYWLKTELIAPTGVNEKVIEKFLSKHLTECFCPVARGAPLRICRPALKQFFQVLQDHYPIVQIQKPASAIDTLLDGFSKHMLKVRGLTLSSVSGYSRHIRKFLEARCGKGLDDLKVLTAQDIREYVANNAQKYKPGTIKELANSLKVFFRFLKITHQVEQFLDDAVPTVANRKLSTIPKYLTQEQLQCLLSSFQLSAPIGLRDRAMVELMARMGLRACEVAQLHLADINWREGVIQLKKSKSRYAYSLPLHKKAGDAIADYLQNGRPPIKEQHLFVSHTLPVGRPLSPDAVRRATYRAFKRSNLPVPSYGTHVLRHTLATQLLQNEATLKEIADILRHKSIETTNIYAKVDLERLKQVSLPWPEVSL